MRQIDSDAGIGARLFLIAFGAIGAFCLWALADSWGAQVMGARVFLALFSFSAVFFGVALALSGPLSVGRSLIGAVILALPVTGLISWAGFRFADASQFLDDGIGLVFAGVFVVLATPFLSVLMSDRARVMDYATLFDTAWTITVRYAAGWLFVGVFWSVVFLSNALLELVGIDVIEVLFDVDWVRFALSGAMLGLGLAVAFELREVVSPQLLLRLLRLVLPVLLVVVSVFLAVLPFRGLSQLFGDFSSAATLMGVAIAAISLISTALDRDDTQGVHAPLMRAAARALAFTVPVLSALAFWAVMLRVEQYAWTPERVLAATVAGLLLLYGLTYVVAALRGPAWREAIRRGNVVMALMSLGAAALWLTPLLHAERISAQSQLARFEQGLATADQLPLWEMRSEWGRAGQTALARLAGLDDPVLTARLAALDTAQTRYDFQRSVIGQSARTDLEALIPRIGVRPQGAVTLSADLFADLPDYRITRWSDGCAREVNDRPGCVWISGAFLPGIPATDQAVILFDAGGRVEANHVVIRGGRIAERVRELYDLGSGSWAQLPPDAISQVLEGAFEVVPSGVSALQLESLRLVPGN